MKSAYFRHQATKILGALCGTQVKLGYGEIFLEIGSQPLEHPVKATKKLGAL